MTKQNINILVAKFGWSEEQIFLGLRAKFQCEYCNKDMFKDVDNYKLWQVDHIIPQSAPVKNFEHNSIENLAISCRQCNVNFKSNFNVGNILGYEAGREEYISYLREYVYKNRELQQIKLEIMKLNFTE